MIQFPRLITFALLLTLVSFDYKDPAIEYINTYSTIAMYEMQRSGIPASIKLAQALLESESGKSPLAVNANNHFGIKCGRGWEGNTYYKHDDDLDSTGTLIESCFRSFTSAEESFKAHSEFLTDPKKTTRYGFLFSLDQSDYKSWANGLKNAGYATDQTYPSKLIRLIEKYELTKFDSHANLAFNHNAAKKNNDKTISTSRLIQKEDKPAIILSNVMLKTTYVNEVRSVKIPIDLTAEQIASILKYDVVTLLSNNEAISSSITVLGKGTIVALEEKKKDYHGKEKFHIVQQGETLESISNRYGIKARSLYILNKIPNSSQPLEGEKIFLKEKVNQKNKPKFKRKPENKDTFLF